MCRRSPTPIYLLGRALVLRQEHVDLDGTGADYNVIDIQPLGTPDGVNPNFDVASLEAWLAVDDRTPVMLEVPEIINRHYNVQVTDEWGGHRQHQPAHVSLASGGNLCVREAGFPGEGPRPCRPDRLRSSNAHGRPLNGSNPYVMKFPADQLPAALVNGHWSLTLVSMPGYHVVPNQLDRFLLNSHSPLVCEHDRSLRIYVGPRPPQGVPRSNWLPAPDWKPFQLTMRAYAPKDVVARGEWFPPALATML